MKYLESFLRMCILGALFLPNNALSNTLSDNQDIIESLELLMEDADNVVVNGDYTVASLKHDIVWNIAQQKEMDKLILEGRYEGHEASAAYAIFVLFLLTILLHRQQKNHFISRQNKAIQEKNLQLQQLNQTKDHIFSILGHDLRKPIIAFRGISQKVNYLIDKQDYATLNLLGEEIERDADNLNKLTDNLLNWALTQKGLLSYDPEELNLAEIAVETTSIFERVISEKKLSLNFDINPQIWVLADQNALMTILRNLVDNAIKYTPIGGQINLSASLQEEGVHIKVKDSGVGISSDKLDRIFLLEKNKSEKGTSGEKGVGLGLHLIYELIQLNKGKIDVKSTLQKGTTFNVFLPAVV